MNFFKTLESQFPDADLTIRAKVKSGEVTLSVMPASLDNNDIQPIIVTGNPEELDQQFFDLIAKPLAETITAIVNLEEQGKSVKDAAKKTEPSKAKETTHAPKKEAKKVVSKKEIPAPTEGSLFEAPELPNEESSITNDETDGGDEPISDEIE